MNKLVSRRSLLEALAAAPLSAGVLAARFRPLPVGLELFSVREELQKDVAATLRRVAQIGYRCVEFFAPYYRWSPGEARKVRGELDALGLRCYSTHNEMESFSAPGLGKAMELNHILGSRYIVLASPGPVPHLEGWKRVADSLNQANRTMRAHGFTAGYHNDDHEWQPLEGKRPIEVIAGETDRSVILELDTGNCLASGGDPVAYIRKYSGRIRALHLKDWSPQKKYDVLLGEGIAPWKQIFAAAESVGGAQFYLIEQEGSRGRSEFETARLSLLAYRRVHA